MHAGNNFTLEEAIYWTRRDIYKFVVMATAITCIYEIFDFKFISIPWLPIALIGTAVAFIIGFKNNATYDRMWEGRKIWGAIVNSSRIWGVMSRDFVTNAHAKTPLSESSLKEIHTTLIYRHIAWLTALRHQMREQRGWEYMDRSYNKEYKKYFKVPEEEIPLQDEIKPLLSNEDFAYVMTKQNKASHLLSMQSKHLKTLRDEGFIEDFRHMEMENVIGDLYVHQGKSERIKNFPYPRQFATLNLFFVWLFLILLPFGLVNEFDKLGDHLVWLTIPFSTIVSWVFHTMEKIGESTENPFQGGANDVPITALSRTIEIDLREMLDETELPASLHPINNILM